MQLVLLLCAHGSRIASNLCQGPYLRGARASDDRQGDVLGKGIADQPLRCEAELGLEIVGGAEHLHGDHGDSFFAGRGKGRGQEAVEDPFQGFTGIITASTANPPLHGSESPARGGR